MLLTAMFLSKHPDVKEEHLQSVKHLLCGAAPFSASDAEPLIEKTKVKFILLYLGNILLIEIFCIKFLAGEL